MNTQRKISCSRHPRCRVLVGCAALAVSLALLSGCRVLPEAAAPAPPLQLLDAAKFELPDDCAVTAGQMFRTRFVIRTDGRTGAIVPEDGPSCLQQAMAAWIATFRYEPPAHEEAAATDLMVVTARRGS